MKYLKRFFLVVAMALCFTLCVDSISHAATIKYKETKLGNPVKGFISTTYAKLKVNSSGKIQLNLYEYAAKDWYLYNYNHRYARVTYSSNGKKNVDVVGSPPYSDKYTTNYREAYGNYAYLLDDFDDDPKLILCKKDGEILKTVKIDDSKYKKRKRDYLHFEIAEIIAKNKVRLYYSNDLAASRRYGGMIEVDMKTKKIKQLVATDYEPGWYDGEYVYGYMYDTSSSHGSKIHGKLVLYQTSIKTKKTKKFVTSYPVYNENKYKHLVPIFSFYKGKVMVVCPTGEVYYATFAGKKLKKIGDISHCKNFKKYKICAFAMKSKNEFYILYKPKLKKIPPKDEGEHSYGKVFLAKYKK